MSKPVPVPAEVGVFDLEPAKPPRVPFGLSSVIGLVGLVGAILAGIEGNVAGQVVGGIAAIVTQISRGRQAIELIRTAARAALPYVSAVADLPDRPQ